MMIRNNVRPIQGNQSGFTILELMIATMVFSAVLIVITVGVIQFSKAYYKGVHASATQTTARTISDTVAQSIRFGTPAITPGGAAVPDGVFCAGGYVFAYTQGVRYTGGTATSGNIGLYMQPQTSTGCSMPPFPLTNGRQLLGENMRITYVSLISVAGTTDLYSFSINIAYGDNDLLCIPGHALYGCTGTAAPADANLRSVPNVQCKSSKGAEYCAATNLSITAQKRVGG